MNELIKSEIILDKLVQAISDGNDDLSNRYYNEYKSIYEKITGKKFEISIEKLKRIKQEQEENSSELVGEIKEEIER